MLPRAQLVAVALLATLATLAALASLGPLAPAARGVRLEKQPTSAPAAPLFVQLEVDTAAGGYFDQSALESLASAIARQLGLLPAQVHAEFAAVHLVRPSTTRAYLQLGGDPAGASLSNARMRLENAAFRAQLVTSLASSPGFALASEPQLIGALPTSMRAS